MRKSLLVMVALSVSLLSGCTQQVKLTATELQEKLAGVEVSIRTFDEESNVIDKIYGKSVNIERSTRFDTKDSEGNSKADSSVIKITIGSSEMHHVGSSLVMAEEGLVDIFDEYAKTVNIENTERGVPLINSMVNSLKNSFIGKEKVVLIRSQNGTPLATYAGDNVSLFASDIPKTTIFIIDDEMLVVYRCDYTVYDTALLAQGVE